MTRESCRLVGLIGAAAAAWQVGCGPQGHAPEEIEAVASGVFNGTLVSSANPPQNPGTVAVYHNYVRPCSGTLIKRQWVLTARHCLTVDPNVVFSALLQPSQVKVVRATSPGLTVPATGASQTLDIVAHTSSDIGLIRISPEIASPAGLANGTASALLNTTVRAMGFGRNVDGGDMNVEAGKNTGAGTLRMADLTVNTLGTEVFLMGQNASGQITWHGDSGGPSYKMTDIFGRALPGVAGVHATSNLTTATDMKVDLFRRWIKQHMFTPGAFRGGFMSQWALVGGPGWASIPTLVTIEDDPYFFTTNNVVNDFPGWAQVAGVRALSGDFNGDRMADIALTGGAGWGSIPLALGTGAGNFSVRNVVTGTIPGITQNADARVAAGDINGDGKTDIVVMRGASTQVTIGTSVGDGSFTPSTIDLGSSFGTNLGAAAARLASGDFDGDGRDDIIVLGNSGTNVSLALSNGDGTFLNRLLASPLAGWATASGVKWAVGDFDGDGRDDVAVTGGPGWTDIRVAFSQGTQFMTQQFPAASFPSWSNTAGVKMVSGDYNGDYRDDLSLVGGAGWNTVPIAYYQGGSFGVANDVTVFASWAQQAGVKVVSGH